MGHGGQIWPLYPDFADLGRMRGSRGRKRDHRRSRGTRQERSRPEQACAQVGDGRPSNNAIRQYPKPATSTRARTKRTGRHTRQPAPCATRSGPSRGRRANETGSASRPRSTARAESGSAHSRSRIHLPCPNLQVAAVTLLACPMVVAFRGTRSPVRGRLAEPLAELAGGHRARTCRLPRSTMRTWSAAAPYAHAWTTTPSISMRSPE